MTEGVGCVRKKVSHLEVTWMRCKVRVTIQDFIFLFILRQDRDSSSVSSSLVYIVTSTVPYPIVSRGTMAGRERLLTLGPFYRR